ncbi:sensor histidine kinase [Salinigranum halophilum]|jgi:PAS domain S-box-containing protein|uniref:sensor histidine kinase n=1 Tax=Salinigranum halophilum TaxID=2565931 RepID=UPI00115EC2DC|nr:response regulator [Salinigranum halophilum]
MTDEDSETFHVLHVDDDASVRDLVASFLPLERPALEVRSFASAPAALDALDGVDCIVSDYEMPEMDGLAFLKRVRADSPDLPFVLYTAAGSEELAAEAISAGVTDYFPKSTKREQYTLLANRVQNFATQYRTARAMGAQQRRFRKLVEYSSDVVSIVDANGVFQYLSPAASNVFGYDPDDLVGEVGFDYLHPDDVEYAVETLFEAIADPSYRPVITFRFAHPEKGWVVLENTGRNLIDDPDIEGFVINSHDVTERVAHVAELERQRDRLAEFASVVSHDLRNPLSVAGGNLSLLEQTGDTAHAAHIRLALERMETIIDDLLTLAREGENINSLGPVSLSAVAESAWQSVDTKSARLSVDTPLVVLADAGRLQQLLENLFSNAVTYAGPTAHVRVFDLRDDRTHDPAPTTGQQNEPTRGFAVADDGPGIPPSDRERVLDYGVSSDPDRTGFGLAIVRRVAEAHGWTVTVTDRPDGGAMFVFTDVRTPAPDAADDHPPA